MVGNSEVTPFWGNFRVGGDSPETPKFVALALDSSLGGDNALIQNGQPQRQGGWFRGRSVDCCRRLVTYSSFSAYTIRSTGVAASTRWDSARYR
jgi:hypothetical protein